MIIYFDESYDRRHRYLLLGALFLPETRLANRGIRSIKKRYRDLASGHKFSDLKYSKSNDNFMAQVCRDVIDLFVLDQSSYFRCVVIDTGLDGFSWRYFGGGPTPTPLVKARAYNSFASLILGRNLEGVQDAVLLADRLTRTPGDNFADSIIADLRPRIREVRSIDSGLEQYQLGQMCDILLGVVLGDLVPPKNANKLGLIEDAKHALKAPSFEAEYWQSHSRPQLDRRHGKFQVWHWKPQ